MRDQRGDILDPAHDRHILYPHVLLLRRVIHQGKHLPILAAGPAVLREDETGCFASAHNHHR